MIGFFDAFALVKRFVEEAGSDEVHRLFEELTPAVSHLSAIEVASALGRLVREGALEAAERDRLLDAVSNEIEGIHGVELTPAVTRSARTLLERHPLRAGDAVQLASAVVLRDLLEGPVRFVTFDRRLREAAAAEGFVLESDS